MKELNELPRRAGFRFEARYNIANEWRRCMMGTDGRYIHIFDRAGAGRTVVRFDEAGEWIAGWRDDFGSDSQECRGQQHHDAAEVRRGPTAKSSPPLPTGVMNMPFRYSFDSKCFDLAEHFLPPDTTQAVKNELAQAIQDAVENFGIPQKRSPPKRDCSCIPPAKCICR